MEQSHRRTKSLRQGALTGVLLQALDDEAVASLIPGLTSALPTAAMPLLVPTGTDGTKQEATNISSGELQTPKLCSCAFQICSWNSGLVYRASETRHVTETRGTTQCM